MIDNNDSGVHDFQYFDPTHYCKRWVAYYDLLGITDRIESGDHRGVFEALARAIEEAKKQADYLKQARCAWFFDSFIIYNNSERDSDYPAIELFVRRFAYALIVNEIPMRGAIAWGEFYADQEHSLYFGQALVEAHRYGEAQDWLGLVYCPTVVERLKSLGIEGPRLNSAEWPNPIKEAARSHFSGKPTHIPLPAYIMGQDWAQPEYQVHPGVAALTSLRNASDRKFAEKYNRAIEFIETTKRAFPRPQS